MIEDLDIAIVKQDVAVFLQKMTIDGASVKVESSSLNTNEGNQDVVNINITLPDPKMLIGHSGYTLFDLSHLFKIILNKKLKKYFYINLDINDYKKKKVEFLKNLAESVADEVVLTKEKKVLLPMPAYERRIIHAKLAERQDVKTESQGEGLDRCVVVALR